MSLSLLMLEFILCYRFSASINFLCSEMDKSKMSKKINQFMKTKQNKKVKHLEE